MNGTNNITWDGILDYSEYLLKVVGGVMRGKILAVPADSFVLGRYNHADVRIDDSMISRRHCRIFLLEDKWYLEDLDSTNGTWLGGQKVDSRVLLPLNTSIRLGTTVLQMRCPAIADRVAVFSDSEQVSNFLPASLIADISGEDLAAKNDMIGAIYRFQNEISSIMDREELYEKIIFAAQAVQAADRVCLLVFDLEAGEFRPYLSYRPEDKEFKHNPSISVSAEIINFVKEKNEAILSRVAGNGCCELSVMCVPMIGKDQINGMIYLERAEGRYFKEDLCLMTVLAGAAGMAVEYSNMLEFNSRNERLVATGSTAAGLSHYIKNILAGLEGSMTLLQKGVEEKDNNLAVNALDILRKNHKRLGGLVIDLLSLSSNLEPNRKLADLRLILQEVYDLMNYQLLEQGIKLVFDPPLPDYPVFAEVDVNGIHRTVLNLVNNSAHAIMMKKTKKGGRNNGVIKLSAYMEKDRDYAGVTVTDDGVGIDEQEQRRIFDLFITSKGSAGTGLGLAVCRKIIELHGGDIYVKSEKNHGCTITFSVPISIAGQDTTAIGVDMSNNALFRG